MWRMMDRMTIGKAGEAIALEYLSRKGFKLLGRNLHLGRQEIDLIMESSHFCHIIEVKTLTCTTYRMPFEKVDYVKRQNLLWAARQFVRRERMDKEIKFDVVSVLMSRGKVYVKYLPDSFTADNVYR